ncbi:Asp23/Gls24 family envelope stress response protein [Allokutzneria albata]|uniref:Asp23 family, cell envelope-related function n=1 Tax=Allokutzneria albata TaxID=211114 RepID=A0A1G9WMR8_ALLAB|nr:hypothetical protein [Allokutzneria albata]SDM85446.1 hypothetical protein SAMN04489726_3686 [Allokutzneria albata]
MDPAERGALEIRDGVLRKLVSRLVDDAPETARECGVRITGTVPEIDISVRLALRYPAPVRAAAEAVRERIVTEVGRVTGYTVRRLDMTVTALVPRGEP